MRWQTTATAGWLNGKQMNELISYNFARILSLTTVLSSFSCLFNSILLLNFFLMIHIFFVKAERASERTRKVLMWLLFGIFISFIVIQSTHTNLFFLLLFLSSFRMFCYFLLIFRAFGIPFLICHRNAHIIVGNEKGNREKKLRKRDSNQSSTVTNYLMNNSFDDRAHFSTFESVVNWISNFIESKNA